MNSDNFQLDADEDFEEMCGKIFVTTKGKLAFICDLCDNKYANAENLLIHLSETHLAQEDSKPDVNILNMALEMRSNKNGTYQRHPASSAKSSSREYHEQNDPLALNSIAVDSNLSSFKNEAFCQEKDEPNKTKHKIVLTTPADNKRYIELRKSELSNELQTIRSTARKRLNIVKFVDPKSFCEIRPLFQIDCQPDTGHSIIDKIVSEAQAEEKQERENLFSNLIKDLFKSAKVKARNTMLTAELNETTQLKPTEKAPTEDIQYIRCLTCPGIFIEVDDFRDHLKDHEHYICPRCGRGFLRKYQFDQHVELLNTAFQCKVFSQPVKCHLCDFAFASSTGLESHTRRHFHTDHYQCDRCSANFDYPEALQRHLCKHTEEKVHECPICGVKKSRKSALNAHMWRHSEENKNVQCASCPSKFFTRADLIQHVKFVHTTERPFLCSECGVAFPVIAKLTLHKAKHHTVRERNIKCELCPKMFFEKETLRSHMLTHSDERKHVCSICNAAFKKQYALVSHIKIHENKREYKCELCEKSFNQRPGLISHMKSVHNEEL